MDKITIMLVSLILCFSFSGCEVPSKENNSISKNQGTTSYQRNGGNTILSQKIESAVKDIINTKVEAVQQKDIEKYLNTVNKEDKEYYAEQKHWFQDILVSDIQDYSLQVLKIEEKLENSYLVSLYQKYSYAGKKYDMKYKAIYKVIGADVFDCDLDFYIKETEHFTIKYSSKKDKLAESFAKAAEEAYDLVLENYGKVPEDKTVIKIYDNADFLRQFVKLSFQWNMAGWYEYSEAIKFIGMESEAKAGGLAHELIHKVTIKESNNNMPYWFAEGVAAYYSGDNIINHPARKRMSILQLENTDLEKLTNNLDIISFYGSAQEVIEYIISKYGEESIHEIIEELSKFPLEDKTGSEVYKRNIEIFNIVAKKVLDKTTGELDQELIK